MRGIIVPEDVKRLLDSRAPVAIGVSGGKDSHAVAWALAQELKGYGGPKLLIHADLGSTEWLDSGPTCKRIADRIGWEFTTCARPAGGLMERWESRWQSSIRRYTDMLTVAVVLPWSTPAMRFCTSETKVDPICATLKRRFGRVPIINVTGVRGEESGARALQPVSSPGGSKLPPGSLAWRPIHHWTLQDVWDAIAESGIRPHEAYGTYGSSRVSCRWCLAGETEVVTDLGIVPIASLAGKKAALLIPKRTPYGLSGEGSFREVAVNALGIQPLWSVQMRRGKIVKTVRATAEHRWFTSVATGSRPHDKTTVEKTTEQLVAGDCLRSLRAHASSKMIEVPFGVAQGFVYGDGSRGSGRRPAELTIYEIRKDSVMLPYFACHDIRDGDSRGKPIKRIYGLPRTWKDLPAMEESRSFLLSWLSGYFAADGTVTGSGSARLDSADLKSLEFARSVAAICGVGYGSITKLYRVGIRQTVATAMYRFNLDPDTLPAWFFRIERHIELVRRRTGRGARIDRVWKVESVTATGEEAEVFCAEVPGEMAFGLGDELMTGNCILANEADLKASLLDPAGHPVYIRMCDLELASGFAFQGNRWLTSLGLDIVPAGAERLELAKKLAERRTEAQAWIPKHLQFTRGWPHRVPTLEESELLAQMRSVIGQLYGWDVKYTTGPTVQTRYQELMELKQLKK